MPKRPSPADLSRADKALIARALHENLLLRAQQGPAAPALDAFIAPLDAVATRLETHVLGKDTAGAVRAALADQADKVDVEVDSLCRHSESFLDVEGHRRVGPHVSSALALHTAAFPNGRAFLDDHIPQQNTEVRKILTVLRAPEHQDTLKSITFPMSWLDRLEAAVEESDAAYAAKSAALGSRGDHVNLGKDAEAAWLDIVSRLRKCVESRTPAGDAEAAAEARALIAPLVNAVAHAKAVAASRATRRTKKGAGTGSEVEAG